MFGYAIDDWLDHNVASPGGNLFSKQLEHTTRAAVDYKLDYNNKIMTEPLITAYWQDTEYLILWFG